MALGELVLGNNEILVAVTAENGTQTIYKIYVYRSEEEVPEEQPEPEVTPNPLPEKGMTPELSEDGLVLTVFQTYKVCEKPEEYVLPDGYVDTVSAIVRNKIRYCDGVLDTDYFRYLFSEE